MKLRKWLATGLLLTPLTVLADTAGFWVGGGSWDWEVSGKIRYQSTDINDDFDLKNDLGLQDDKQSFGYIKVEHPIPVLPNIRFSSTDLSTRGTGSLSASKTFNGVTYSASETVTTELVLDQTDLALYYQVLDNVVGFDLGLNLKNIDGLAQITGDTSGTARDEFDAIIPMLYAGLEISLPLTGLSIGADGSYIGYDGNSLTDITAFIRYSSDYFLGLEAGVRTVSLELDDVDSTYAKIDFDGPYVSLFLHF